MKPTILLSGILITLFSALPLTVPAKSIASTSTSPSRFDWITNPSTYSTLSFGKRLARRAQVNEECRLVHDHEDKCEFVKKNCGDEEIGVFDYVDLYYCKLPNAPVVSFMILGGWLALLFTTLGIAASEFFCVNLSTIATILGMSESITGVTFLALGNGSPDVFSTFAAMKIDAASLAIGELVGAACFISAVVAGAMALVAPDFKVARRSFVRDVSFFIIAVVMIMVFLADGHIRFWECMIMVVFYISYVMFVVGWHWFSGKQKRRRVSERTARDMYVPLEEEADESDEDEDGGVGRGRGGRNTDMFSADFAALENGDDDQASDEASEQQAYAELSSNMRIVRPRTERNHTARSIRPSLAGALEFRSLLNSLQKNKNLGGGQIRLQTVSDENLLSARHASSAPGSRLNSPNMQAVGATEGRPRAVSDIRDVERPVLVTPPKSENLLLSLPGSSDNSPSASRPNLPQIITDSGDFDAFQGKSVPLSPLVLPERLEDTSANDSPLLLDSPGGEPPSKAGSTTNRSQRNLDNLGAYRHMRRGSVATSDFMLPPPSPKWNDWSFWPYEYLPPPQELFSILFPTLSDFKEKTLLDKLSSIAVVPSVFLLTITLPVVDIPAEKDEDTGVPKLQVESPGSSIHEDIPAALSAAPEPEESRHVQWNRWLVLLQCILAPIFVVLTALGESGNIIFPILYGILAGIIGIAIILNCTTPDSPPKLRYLLCFVGFIVSISWISTIANEVVGVLKAFGVILGISDAILGLTVFAVGNSLSDLVANITVARLGYPVMALSACFGGPMLNILLGIGISGLYMTVSKNEPYAIDVSPTLVISAVTLLITLLTLIVFVPLNQWRMTRRIGFTIIGVWTTSTLVNLVVEAMGWGHRKLPEAF